MLIYANEFYLQASDKALANFKAGVKSWLGKKLGPAFNSTKIIPFDQPFIIRHPETGTNEVTIFGTPDQAPDYCLSINYRHNDARVNGRAWFTRIGIERPEPTASLRVTVVLETSEVSPQVAEHRITPTQPGVVGAILSRCPLAARTPGAHVRPLDGKTITDYLTEVEDPYRFHTILVVSSDEFSEEPLVDVEELQKRLVGLAQVYLIPDKRVAWKLRNELAPFHTAWDGSITVISPSRNGRAMGRVFRQDEIEALAHDSGLSFEHYLFSDLTHRQNLPKSRRHIGDDLVGRRLIGFKLAKLREKTASIAGLDEIVQSYEEDRDKAKRHAEDIEFKLLSAEEVTERLREEKEELEKKIRTLQFQLRSANATPKNASVGEATQEETPSTLDKIGDMAASNFEDQLIITNHARKTLKNSPFLDVERAWGAFKVLANEFYAAFTGELQMQDAIDRLREIPGKYAGNQSEITAGRNSGYQRSHNGRKYSLSRHIVLGTARDPQHCFRLYFEWEPEEQKIIVLHAGEHLDTQST